MKILKASITLILLGLSQSSFSSVYLVHDEKAYYQDLYANIQRMIESAKKLVEEKAQLQAMANTAESQVDAVNNGFANVIARLDKGAEERQNLEQLEKAQPAKDACDTFTLSAGLENSACSELDQIDKLSRDRAQRYSVATGGGISNTSHVADVQDVNAENTRAAVALMDECQSLDGNCQKAALWFGKALTADEYKALQLQNDIAANTSITVPEVTGLKPGTPEHTRALTQDLMREQAREQTRFELEALTVATHGTLSEDGERKPGKVELYEEYSSKRLGSEKWMCAITNTCADEYVPPDEINRRSIEIKAVAASLELDKYKSALRTEALLQTALFHNLNKSTSKQQ
jgi:hypothetical protein